MSEHPEQPDEMREVLGRLENEFKPRQDNNAAPPADAPRYRDAVPAPEQRAVRLQLPLSRPRVVYGLIGLNVVMYLFTYIIANRIHVPYRDAFFASDSGPDAPFNVALYVLGAKWAPAIIGGQYWRLVAPIFLHGGLIHLAFNSYALYVMGPQAERVYGTARFFVVYLLAGIAGNVASFLVAPDSLAIGASGAIFGLIGALAAWAYVARPLVGKEASDRQLKQLVGLAAINLILGFTIANIDNSAHVGGLIVGALTGLALAPRYTIDQRLYPPVVVAGARSSGWVLSGGIALLVLAIAAFGVIHGR